MDSVKNGIAWAWTAIKFAYEFCIAQIEACPKTTFWVGLTLLVLAVWF